MKNKKKEIQTAPEGLLITFMGSTSIKGKAPSKGKDLK